MGVQLNAQQNCNQAYVQAVSKFNKRASERSAKFYLRSDFLWKILGYEQEENENVKILHSFTEKVQICKLL